MQSKKRKVYQIKYIVKIYIHIYTVHNKKKV